MTHGIGSGSRPKIKECRGRTPSGRRHRVSCLRFNADEDEALAKWVAEHTIVPDQGDSFGRKPNVQV